MEIKKAPSKMGDLAKIFPARVLTVSLVLSTCTEMQGGSKLKKTLLNKKEPRLADLEAFQKLQWPNDVKIKHLSTKAGIWP